MANGQLSFAHNVPKQYIEIFHQMDLIISYKSIQCSLSINTITVKKFLQNKATEKRFFISYDIKNFYEKLFDQRLHKKAALISYIVGYVYFINTPESSNSSTDN